MEEGEDLDWQLQELFLLFDDGRLLAHASLRENQSVDSEIVGSMLTAVSDFVGDSFSTRDGLLEHLRAGDLNVMLQRANPLMLAGIVSGTPPAGFGQELQSIVEEMCGSYSYLVDEQWNGSTSLLNCVQEGLKAFLCRD